MTDPVAPYGRLYGALAPLCLVFSFLPPFAVGKGLNSDIESFGSVWDMAGTPGGAPARAAVYLLLLMFGCLLAATTWPHMAALPVINAVAATTIGALLVTRPHTGEPSPDLSPAGRCQLVVTAGIVVVSIIHMGHLTVLRRQPATQAAGGAATHGGPGPSGAGPQGRGRP